MQLDEIRRLTVVSETQGVEKTTQQMRDLASAHEGVSGAAGRTTAASVSMEGALARHAQQAKQAAQESGLLVAALAAIAGLATIATIVKLNDEFHKLAGTIADIGRNARTSAMAMGTFQAYQYTFAAAGVSADKYNEAVQKIAKNLNDARTGENDMTKMLDANNIKWKENGKVILGVNDVLLALADLINRAATEQDKIKIAEKFGLSKDVIPALQSGAAELRKLAKEANDLGGILDKDLIAKAEKFDRDWKLATAQVSLYFRAWVAQIITVIADVMEHLDISSILQKISAIDAKLSAMKSVSLTGDFLADAQKLGEFLKTLPDLFNQEAKGIENANEKLGEMRRLANDLAGPEVVARIKQLFDIFTRPASAPTPPGGQPPNFPKNDEDAKRWDREIIAIQKHTATLVADTLAVSSSAGQHAALRAEMQLLRAAEEDKLGVTKKQIAEYTELRATMGAQQALEASGITLSKDRVKSLLELAAAANKAQQALAQSAAEKSSLRNRSPKVCCKGKISRNR